MGRKQVMIGVRPETLERIKAAIAKMIEQQEHGDYADVPSNPEPINPKAQAISIDAFLNRLLDEAPRKRKAAKDSREKRKAQQAQDVTPAEGVETAGAESEENGN